MKHLKKGKKFGRIRGRRKSFIAGLINNLVMKERIKTTEARAKELKPKVEKLITLAKKQNIASLRLLKAKLPEKSSSKLYYEIAPRYVNRKGGYLKVTKTAIKRKRDAAPIAVIEFIK
ncbi:MAG: 50S ribosomal protein L17 [Parcubacteria group bacterium CG1_02_42_13]|uniref:50S ribosomal protein L17 n=1 Tax=Candidatus Colwellbacteria bacterium CG23_combo_of_CG06-09_8_20_14_all_42_19 TaxID=1974541 RepID=A0A2H0AL97_9BACT|nr:MAG: 50S ribosomal protein L17 [Parcubacteria group bacterium CG1_02_42_13]PIP46189.1 MAG: 50S ribosomal protein L17 [Candidatus Colwellbacteria bacterium CG23_combo_of_CG06-09_8_20_14_all_42_19]